MKKIKELKNVLSIIALIGVGILFLNVTGNSADFQDTLWVDTERANNAWIEIAACTEGVKTTCIDEQNTADDADYLYSMSDALKQDWCFLTPPDTSNVLDSVGFFIRGLSTSTGTAQDLVLAYRLFQEAEWQVVFSDTVTLTSSFDNYSMILTEGSPGYPWLWIYLFWEEIAYGVISQSVATGSKGHQWRASWSGLVYYYHSVEAEAEGNPRRIKLKKRN